MGRSRGDYKEKVQQYKNGSTPRWCSIIRGWDVMQPERLRNDSNASKVQKYKNYGINEMGTWGRTFCQKGKIMFLRVRYVFKGYVLTK